MKKIFLLLLIGIGLASSAQAPFSRGVNLTNWFQSSTPRQIQFAKYTQQDFSNIKSLGCDVVRLPINLHAMTNGAPDYTLDPLFIDFLDQAVAWCYNLDMHLILDNHTFDVNVNTTAKVREPLLKVWMQLASLYAQHPAKLYYEILNEPHGIADALWNDIQSEVVDSIRTVDSTHTIIVGPASWNSYNNLDDMPLYDDDNLIYTFHFYDPFIFTHQGASWTDPSMLPLAGVPFPYGPNSMPDFPTSLAGTWIQSQFQDYQRQGTVAKVKELINIAVDFQNTRNVPVFCGEFGVLIDNANNADRVFWYETVRRYLEENDVAWTIWDYQGSFGLFGKNSYEMFDYDLNVPLVEALGLNAPAQKEHKDTTDVTGFSIYTDYLDNNLTESSWNDNDNLDYYYTDAVVGKYCIHWTGAEQYEAIRLDFIPDRDLSYLVDAGWALDFWVRGDTPDNLFDIRFLDTDTSDPEDHPWRRRVIMNDMWLTQDNQWHHLQIPLREFVEQGAWESDTWYNPVGKFDWSKIDMFEIVAEHGDMAGMDLYFDEIRIVDPAVTGVDAGPGAPDGVALHRNYPNPFNPVTRIVFDLPVTAHVDLGVYNMRGQRVATLVDGARAAGQHTVTWNAGNHASGVYWYRIQAGGYTAVQKMVLVK